MAGKWWENNAAVGLIVAVIATVPPITAGVSSYITSEAQIRLQKEKQLHEVQLSYLDRALDQSKSLEYRLGVLDFLSNSLQEGELKKWAAKTKENVAIRIAKIQKIDHKLKIVEDLQLRAESQLKIANNNNIENNQLLKEELLNLATKIAELKNEIKLLASSRKAYSQSATALEAEIKTVIAQQPETFLFPVDYKLVNNTEIEGRGIFFELPPTTEVKSSEDGEVVYSGYKLRGYGNLMIINHNSDYMTVYANNKELLLREGDKVLRGDVIALSGEKGLHYEIREKGKPLKPEDVERLTGIKYNTLNKRDAVSDAPS